MDDNSSRHTTVALLDTEPNVLLYATCPMCHTPTSMTEHAIETGGHWRCVRCGQRWDAGRLAAVAAYAAWAVDHDRVARRATEVSQEAALYRSLPTEWLGGRP
jgi:hypothetical protein